jgi:hypothetical protein
MYHVSLGPVDYGMRFSVAFRVWASPRRLNDYIDPPQPVDHSPSHLPSTSLNFSYHDHDHDHDRRS